MACALVTHGHTQVWSYPWSVWLAARVSGR